MCGIFGIVLSGAQVASKDYLNLVQKLYQLSENRGKESSGLHLFLPEKNRSWTLKGAQSASMLLKSKEYQQITHACLNTVSDSGRKKIQSPMITLAHSRLVTNGSANDDLNNQPVQWGPITVIHNGIIVNVEQLWQQYDFLTRYAEVDTEIIAAMLADSMKNNAQEVTATRRMFNQIKGAASIAWVNDASNNVVLATNTGDLHYLILPDDQGLVFASERYMLEQLLPLLARSFQNQALLNSNLIHGLTAGNAMLFSAVHEHPPLMFDLNATNSMAAETTTPPIERHIERSMHFVRGRNKTLTSHTKQYDASLLNYNEASVKALKRCSRCVLPHTFPFIQYDNDGVCNYCNSHQSSYATMHHTDAKKDFIASLEHYRRNNGSPDVLVPFSGGRDSSYGLHLICKEFGLNPITFTYDWGMVTDLARRNIARMCGQLGVPNILVSANIPAKRKNIRNNVSAWLKKPDTGIIPLFMAGDKSFFKIVNTLKKQTGISLNLWCANPLENTNFKSGFCGIRPEFNKDRLDYLSLGNKAKLALYYGSRFLTNPAYLNTSLVDSFAAFLAYYFEPRQDFYFIFNHFIWNENEVNRVLLSDYDWETSSDSASTWRIGDGSAPFYNYIYNIAYGFSEFDTFRSNQIREGMITRHDALESLCVDNRPREASLHWYLDAIGLDFDPVIKRINQLDVLGIHR